ncbi:hypothetical protein BJ912DRAFT_586242 [Pholiota molesta]|nr:hypothetical protein BJ912DRAFT_586242 [Pholiota molesta]
MPLPTNSSLVLLPSSKPGDALHAKPKHAMLLRMSSQTLDALESFPTNPQVQFQFGDSPGLFIGDTHFPIQYSPENTIHELYLRASSATKKTAPLKLYANVVGKLAVERELANDLRDKIRESTQDAAAQRNNRTTVLLEAPLDLPTNNKKRKDPPASSSMFRKPLRPADKLKVVPAPANASSTPLNKPAVSSASTQRDLPVPLRRRMIQCLAVSDRTEDHITKLVAGAEPTAALRRDVQDLLEVIAEPIMGKPSDKSPKTYRLKPVSWKEARPYEWSGLSESERKSIARAATVAFQNLNIPESDPIWNHVRYRSPTSLNPSTSSDRSKSSASNPAEDRIKKEVVAKRGSLLRETLKTRNQSQRPTLRLKS